MHSHVLLAPANKWTCDAASRCSNQPHWACNPYPESYHSLSSLMRIGGWVENKAIISTDIQMSLFQTVQMQTTSQWNLIQLLQETVSEPKYPAICLCQTLKYHGKSQNLHFIFAIFPSPHYFTISSAENFFRLNLWLQAIKSNANEN